MGGALPRAVFVVALAATVAGRVRAAEDPLPLPLAVGGAAPALMAPGVTPATDIPTSGVMTLIFSKPDDTHTRDAVSAIAELHRLHPHLGGASRTLLVVSRANVHTELPSPELPKGWVRLADSQDELYRAWHVIATPTVAVVDAEGRIVGLHPGWSPALADAVRRDLRSAIDGPESLNAATPTPGIMDVQMGRALARRRLFERALRYYRNAAARELLPCAISLEEVEIHLELRQPAEALALLDGITVDESCAAEAKALRSRAEAMKSAKQNGTPVPPRIP